MSNKIKIKILNYCESVKIGSKPVAMIPIPSKDVNETTSLVKNEYPNNIFEQWAFGKLFGYSDEAIGNFVTKP